MKACHLDSVRYEVGMGAILYVPLEEYDVPPCPTLSFCSLLAHLPPVWITVKSHGDAHAYELCANGPYLLAVRLAEGEIVAADKEALDEFEGVRSGLCSMSIECSAHDVIKSSSQFLVAICEVGDERVPIW
jgi:hypothetical protein